jgi:ribosomal protein S18 acetylase RimI-like enzyme
MLKLICDPPAAGADAPEPFFQSIRLLDGQLTVAQARWQSGQDSGDGVVHLVDLSVSAAQRRKGFGMRMMETVFEQAKAHFKARKSKLKRIWIAVEQKRQVIARSFLMKFGFHHVGTVTELLRDGDLLIYARSFD